MVEYEQLYGDISRRMQKSTTEEGNLKLLSIFEAELRESGVSDNKISRMLEDVEYYLNTYLLRFASLANAVSTEDMSRSDPNDVSTIASGIDQIHSYFSGFYLDTCPWASGKRLRKSVNAIRSFYATMKEHGKISAAEYKRLNKIIATFLPRWEVMAEIKWGE